MRNAFSITPVGLLESSDAEHAIREPDTREGSRNRIRSARRDREMHAGISLFSSRVGLAHLGRVARIPNHQRGRVTRNGESP